MIVRLGSWRSHPLAAMLCEKLSEIEGSSQKSTPQRCYIKLDSQTIATVGADSEGAVVEFAPGKEHYAAAHGSRFARPQSLGAMARQGWLQARPGDCNEAEQVLARIVATGKSREIT